MNKIKVVCKCGRQLILKGMNGQQLNENEVYAINSNKAEGLLLFDVENNGYKVKLKYNVKGLIPYSDFLHLNNMSRRLFIVLLRNIILILKGIENNRFSKDLLMWSLQTTYVEPTTWHVYMMYVPLQPFEVTGNLKSFLLEMISQCNFVPNEDIEYVQRLVEGLNSVTAYTIGMLESYCDQVSDELWKQKRKNDQQDKCPVCGSKLTVEETVCPFCGKQRSSQMHIGPKLKENICCPEFAYSEKENQTKIEQSNLTRRAISINEDENGIVTVFRGAQSTVKSVWLEDCSREGKILISKFPFRIGKMEGVTDYRIFNNAVSRKHADILKDQGKYYIVDLGSTNGTYLKGKRIQPGVKEELTDGLLIKFADSEFKIHID